MFNVHRKEIDWGGRKLVLETGKVARQATGAVMATYGETMVLCTVVATKGVKEGQDFFPLTVNYQEKAFAAGKIPGGFFKREGRPADSETLICRLIDRPVRPLFADGFRNDTQIICTVLQHDLENDPDIVAMVGASAALTISGLPFMGPLGAARVGVVDGEYVLNPTLEQMKDTRLDLVVAGTGDAVMMVESEADELTEDEMLGAVMFGHKSYQKVIDGIIDLAEMAAKDAWPEPAPLYTPELADAVAAIARDDLAAAYGIRVKTERQDAVAAAKAKVMETLGEHAEGGAAIGAAFKSLEKNIVRRSILDTGMRIDGRDTKTIRPIECEVGILPRAHGSALFTRGETQALVVTTLGTGQDEQIIDALVGESRQHFMPIAALLKEWEPEALVVGLPLNMDGSESESTARARKFANRLKGRFGMKVWLVDERLSTREARERTGIRKADSRVDSMAAVIIAEGFLREGGQALP